MYSTPTLTAQGAVETRTLGTLISASLENSQHVRLVTGIGSGKQVETAAGQETANPMPGEPE